MFKIGDKVKLKEGIYKYSYVRGSGTEYTVTALQGNKYFYLSRPANPEHDYLMNDFVSAIPKKNPTYRELLEQLNGK